MKKHKKLTASFLLEALASFTLISTLILFFLPIVITQHRLFQKEIEKADMNRILLTVVKRHTISQLKQGIILNDYEVYIKQSNLCIKNDKDGSSLCHK